VYTGSHNREDKHNTKNTKQRERRREERERRGEGETTLMKTERTKPKKKGRRIGRKRRVSKKILFLFAYKKKTETR
jgi:hypothetical protein